MVAQQTGATMDDQITKKETPHPHLQLGFGAARSKWIRYHVTPLNLQSNVSASH